MLDKIKIIRMVLALSLVIGLAQFSLAEEVYELEKYVVTGTRTERLLADVPVRTEVLTAEDIAAKGAVNLYDALEGIPGIRVEQQCSYCNFSIVRMQGLESGHVQVLIDGQPIFSGVAGVYGLQQIPASTIERIEVVKGAGSALYGSSAIAGVINIITKKAGKEPETVVEAEIGEEGTRRYGVTFSRAFENMDVLIYSERDEADEIYLGEKPGGSHMTDRVWTRANAVGTKMNFYNLNEDDTLTLSARFLQEERKGGELETFEDAFAAGSECIDTERYEVQLGYKKPVGPADRIGLTVSLSRHLRDATNDTFLGDYMATHGDAEPPAGELEPYNAEESQVVLDLNYTRPVGEKQVLLGGLIYSYNKLEESGKYVVVDEAAPDYGLPYKAESEKHANEYGVYLQDELSISDGLELVVGARYDAHSSEDSFAGSGDTYGEGVMLSYDEESFNPRMALMYKPEDNLSFRLAAGTGFRVPYGFSEDLHLCSGSPRITKPAGLEPEKSTSVSLSTDYSAEKWIAGASIFRTDLKDKIGSADASPESAALGYDYEWENLGDAYTQGVELGAALLLSDVFKVGLDLTYTDAQYADQRGDWDGTPYAEDSKYISRVPELTAGINLGITPGDWEINLGTDYTGRMYIDYFEEGEEPTEILHTDPFWVVGLKISRHNFLRENVTAFLGVRNLFDEVQDDKRPDDAAFMYAPYYGRIIYTGVKVAL